MDQSITGPCLCGDPCCPHCGGGDNLEDLADEIVENLDFRSEPEGRFLLALIPVALAAFRASREWERQETARVEAQNAAEPGSAARTSTFTGEALSELCVALKDNPAAADHLGLPPGGDVLRQIAVWALRYRPPEPSPDLKEALSAALRGYMTLHPSFHTEAAADLEEVFGRNDDQAHQEIDNLADHLAVAVAPTVPAGGEPLSPSVWEVRRAVAAWLNCADDRHAADCTIHQPGTNWANCDCRKARDAIFRVLPWYVVDADDAIDEELQESIRRVIEADYHGRSLEAYDQDQLASKIVAIVEAARPKAPAGGSAALTVAEALAIRDCAAAALGSDGLAGTNQARFAARRAWSAADRLCPPVGAGQSEHAEGGQTAPAPPCTGRALCMARYHQAGCPGIREAPAAPAGADYASGVTAVELQALRWCVGGAGVHAAGLTADEQERWRERTATAVAALDRIAGWPPIEPQAGDFGAVEPAPSGAGADQDAVDTAKIAELLEQDLGPTGTDYVMYTRQVVDEHEGRIRELGEAVADSDSLDARLVRLEYALSNVVGHERRLAALEARLRALELHRQGAEPAPSAPPLSTDDAEALTWAAHATLELALTIEDTEKRQRALAAARRLASAAPPPIEIDVLIVRLEDEDHGERLELTITGLADEIRAWDAEDRALNRIRLHQCFDKILGGFALVTFGDELEEAKALRTEAAGLEDRARDAEVDP